MTVKLFQRLRTLTAAVVAPISLAFTIGAPAVAQNLFAPVAYVNDSVVTTYELEQRMRLLTILGGAPDRENTLDELINDRLKAAAAERVGLEMTDEQIASGIAEFAARGDLQPEQFLTLMSQNGVSAETVRDFVGIGVIWREYARARFAVKAQINEDEIDRALQNNGPSGGLLVSMSEIFLPARTPEETAQSEALARQISANATIASFAAAARDYSVAPSRDRSGRMEWAAIGDLPPPLRSAVLGLKPGEVTQTFNTGNAIGIFQLRGLAETDTRTPPADAIEYATYAIEGGRTTEALTRAAEIKANVDTCDDLYGVAKGQPESVLSIDTVPAGEIPTDIAVELSKLDAGEVSTALTRNDDQTLVFLMLCGRSYAAQADTDRETIRTQLQSQRIGALADSFVAQLRADANIVIP
ncbi:peptidylprolyl isomerase [Celeribacter litoreus]|uniref:peptidylprolyl isomerase n=1 Tax=Celeribacter litoreus TaxID=2876714 RepID=UPI001CCB307C|nr:peptidylprolyl isomerase [Celeribacter litoreus]MCA0043701.1 peptidylprolyl isomerase [Celeribacter litoreus]